MDALNAIGNAERQGMVRGRESLIQRPQEPQEERQEAVRPAAAPEAGVTLTLSEAARQERVAAPVAANRPAAEDASASLRPEPPAPAYNRQGAAVSPRAGGSSFSLSV
ncbi:MAG: hypothetical protein AB1634_10065 [Thermodesulfobacteriota bacterium]